MKIKKMLAMLLAVSVASVSMAACSKDDSSDNSSSSAPANDSSEAAATTTAAPEDSSEPATTTTEAPAEPEAPAIEATNNDPSVDGKYGHVSITFADGVASFYWGPGEDETQNTGVNRNSNWMPIDKNGEYTIVVKVWDASAGDEEALSPCTDLQVFCVDWTVSEDLKENPDISLNTTSVKFDDVEVEALDFAPVAEVLGENSLNDYANNWENETTFRQNLYNTWGGNLFAFDYSTVGEGFPTYNYLTVTFTIDGLPE